MIATLFLAAFPAFGQSQEGSSVTPTMFTPVNVDADSTVGAGVYSSGEVYKVTVALDSRWGQVVMEADAAEIRVDVNRHLQFVFRYERGWSGMKGEGPGTPDALVSQEEMNGYR